VAHPRPPTSPVPPPGERMNGPRWLGADEVAALLEREPAAVYRLAHGRKWRRYTHNGRVYLSLPNMPSALLRQGPARSCWPDPACGVPS
jgi:hypothetical protein